MWYLVQKKGIDEDEAPLEAIRRMNEMIRSLINKYPLVKFGPWSGESTKLNPLLIEFPGDVDISEQHAFNFNRFIYPGDRSYVRLHGYFPSNTSIDEFEAIISGFKKPRTQFFPVGTF